MGTGETAVPIQLGEPLASWVLDPDLDKYRKMDPRVIVGAALDTIAGGISGDIRADYLACYDGDRFAESMTLSWGRGAASDSTRPSEPRLCEGDASRWERHLGS